MVIAAASVKIMNKYAIYNFNLLKRYSDFFYGKLLYSIKEFFIFHVFLYIV